MNCLINHENNYLNYYFAGRFEESGKINIYKLSQGRGSFVCYVAIRFRTKKEAELFKESFGGRVTHIKSKNNKSWKNVRKKRWLWNLDSSLGAPEFAGAILPFIFSNLMIRKLELIRKFYFYRQKCATRHSFIRGTKKLTDIGKQRKKFYQQMKRLNKQ